MPALETWRIILTVLMLLLSGCFVFSFTSYLRKYKVIQSLFLKIGSSTQAYNLLRREQMRKKIEAQTDFKKPKLSILENIYFTIQQLGILEKLPGFSEIHILTIYVVLLFAVSAFVGYKTLIFGGFICFILLCVITKLVCSFIIVQRVSKIEAQLSLFINACEGASSIHSDIIDIFGAIYERMRPPLNTYLEECYLEAKITNNKKVAIQRLKNKTRSIQFRSTVDNLLICSEATGDYQKTIDDMREPIRIHQNFEKRRRAIVKNARSSILVMTVAGAIVVWISMLFLDGASNALLKSPIGLILLSFALIIMILGLTIKSKKIQ